MYNNYLNNIMILNNNDENIENIDKIYEFISKKNITYKDFLYLIDENINLNKYIINLNNENILHYIYKNINSITELENILLYIFENDIYINWDSKDIQGNTLLHCIFMNNILTPYILNILNDNNILIQKYMIIKNDESKIALHLLCENKNINYKNIEYLLNENLIMNRRDIFGNGPIYYLLNQKNLPYEILIRIVTNYILEIYHQNYSKRCPLHNYFRNNEKINEFFNKGNYTMIFDIDMDINDNNNNTLIHYLFMNENINLNTIKFIIKYYKKNIYSKNNLDITPLHNLMLNNVINKKIIKYLLKENINYKIKTKNGDTLIHYLFEGNINEEIIKIIIRSYNNIDILNNANNTPFHILALNKNITKNIFYQLIKCGCDPFILNDYDNSVIDYIFESDILDYEIFTYIIKKYFTYKNNENIRMIDNRIYNLFKKRNIDYETLLHKICRHENIDLRILEIILKLNLNLLIVNSFFERPIEQILCNNDISEELISLLYKYNINILDIIINNNTIGLYYVEEKLKKYNNTYDKILTINLESAI